MGASEPIIRRYPSKSWILRLLFILFVLAWWNFQKRSRWDGI